MAETTRPSRASEQAMHEADAHAVASQTDAVPEESGHAHSHAAHLHEAGHPNTNPAADRRHGSDPGALRQPPEEISRAGKQHRD